MPASPAYSVIDDQPESVPTPTFSISSTLLPSTPPVRLSHSAAEDVPEIAYTPPSLSSITTPAPSSMLSISLQCLPSATEDQLEPVSTPSIISASLAVPLTSSLTSPSTDDLPILASTLHSSSSVPLTNFEYLPSITVDQPEPEPASISLIPSKLDPSPRALSPPPDHFPAPFLSSSTLEFSPPSETSTPDSLPVTLSPKQLSESLLLRTLGQSSRPCEFESTPACAADIVPLSPPESPLSSIGESVPLLPASLEVSVIVPIPAHSPPLQRSLGVTSNGSVSSPLEVTPFPASPTIASTPQQVSTLALQWLLDLVPQLVGWQLTLISDVSSTRAPRSVHLSITTRSTPQWLLYLVPQLLGSQE